MKEVIIAEKNYIFYVFFLQCWYLHILSESPKKAFFLNLFKYTLIITPKSSSAPFHTATTFKFLDSVKGIVKFVQLSQFLAEVFEYINSSRHANGRRK